MGKLRFRILPAIIIVIVVVGVVIIAPYEKGNVDTEKENAGSGAAADAGEADTGADKIADGQSDSEMFYSRTSENAAYDSGTSDDAVSGGHTEKVQNPDETEAKEDSGEDATTRKISPDSGEKTTSASKKITELSVDTVAGETEESSAAEQDKKSETTKSNIIEMPIIPFRY